MVAHRKVTSRSGSKLQGNPEGSFSQQGTAASGRTVARACQRAPTACTLLAAGSGLAGTQLRKVFHPKRHLHSYALTWQSCRRWRGKHVGKPSKDYDLIWKPILPHKHWDPEQRDNQIWGGSLGKIPLCSEKKCSVSVWHMTVAVRTAEHPQQH